MPDCPIPGSLPPPSGPSQASASLPAPASSPLSADSVARAQVAGFPGPRGQTLSLSAGGSGTAPPHSGALRPRLPATPRLLANLLYSEAERKLRVLPRPTNLHNAGRLDANDFEPMDEASRQASQQLALFHAVVMDRSPSYAALMASTLEAGSIRVQVGQEFGQSGACIWDGEQLRHIVQINPLQRSGDPPAIPAAKNLSVEQRTLLNEMANASAIKRFSEVDALIGDEGFEQTARTTALSSIEQRLFRQPGDEPAVVYAREIERVEFENMKRVALVVEELQAAGMLDEGDPIASSIRQVAMGSFDDYFAMQIDTGHSQLYVGQYHAFRAARTGRPTVERQ